MAEATADHIVAALVNLRNRIDALSERIGTTERTVHEMNVSLSEFNFPVEELATAKRATQEALTAKTKVEAEIAVASAKARSEAIIALVRSPVAYAGAIGMIILVIRVAFGGTIAEALTVLHLLPVGGTP